MEQLVIPSFSLSSGETVRETTAFYNGDRCLLFEKTSGHILCTDRTVFEAFAAHEISSGLSRKLKSHCFIQQKTTRCDSNACPIKPEFFMVDLTNRCNMQCKYCLRDVNHETQSASPKTIADICTYINEYSAVYHPKNISVQPWGGEPLLELDQILTMRRLINPSGTKVHFSIETNGLLLNDEVLKKLYDARIGLGVSIDGYAAIHDGQRISASGMGTHQIVESHLKKAIKLFGDRVGTITTVTKRSAPHIEYILDYLVQEIGLKHVKFNFVHPSLFFDCDDICVDDELIAETILHLLRRLVELIEKGYKIEEHNISVKLRNIITNQFTDICHSRGCNGGRRMIVFDRNGNIYPCEMTDMPEEKLGCIYDSGDLTELVTLSVAKHDFFCAKKEEICDTCEWYVFCRGGCTVRTISCGKRPPMIDHIECAVNRSLYPALMELILKKPDVVNKMLGCDLLEIEN